MVMTAVVALFLIPAASLTRERAQARRTVELLLHAREDALRSVVVAERQRVAETENDDRREKSIDESIDPTRERDKASLVPRAASALEQLQRENAELKDTVEKLRLEVKRLKAANRH
jgi:hypothetical protein